MRGYAAWAAGGVLFMLVAACSHPEFDAMQAAAAAKVSGLSITCGDGPECASKWARALAWVSDHSPYKLRIANDSIITTEGPIDDVAYSTQSAMTVNRVPTADGRTEIVFRSVCANEFGCVPTHEMLLASFADYVQSGAPTANVAKGRLGVHVADVTPAIAAAINLGQKRGVMIGAVDAGSPAEKAGLARGDVVLAVDGREVGSGLEMKGATDAAQQGKPVKLLIWRAGKEMQVELRL